MIPVFFAAGTQKPPRRRLKPTIRQRVLQDKELCLCADCIARRPERRAILIAERSIIRNLMSVTQGA